MSKTLEKLAQIINQSSIPLEDQNDLLIFLPILPEEVLQKLVEVFTRYPKLINEFNQNFKTKLNVLINGRDKWEKIIAEEEEKLKKIAGLNDDEF
jgi:hypothetical protein